MRNVAGRRQRRCQTGGRMRGSIHDALLLSVILACAAAPGEAAPISTGGTPDTRTYNIGDSADHVRIAAVDRASGGNGKVIVVVVIDPGYHINANPASLDYLIPTTLNVTNQTALRVIYPEPVRFKPKFADEALDVYQGTIRIIAEFPEGALTRTGRLFGTLTVQACNDESCLPPADLVLPGR